MINDRTLRELAAEQHGLVTVAQAVAKGFDQGQRHRLGDAHRWERPTPRVLRLVGSSPTIAQRAMLAVLDAGDGAALASSSAAAWWEIPGNVLEPFQVVRGRHSTNRPGRLGTPHEPILLPPGHVLKLDGVPTVVPARALFDIAGSQRAGAKLPWWIDRMARMVDTAWSKRLVSGASLHGMLGEMAQRGRPGIRVMRVILDDRGLDYVPPASGLESRFAQIMRDAGCTTLRRQVDTGDDERWIGRVDFCDDVYPLVVEVQSERFHASLIDQQLDAERIRRLEAAGFVVVTVTDVDVWHRRQQVVQAVMAGRRQAQSLAQAA